MTGLATTEPLLTVEDLRITFPGPGGDVAVVAGASLEVRRRETVGLVGESGSGKTLTALALLRLVPEPGRIETGRIRLGDVELLDLDERLLRRVRGGKVGLVFQEPGSALNPVFTVGSQIAEAVRAHHPGLSRREARTRAKELLELVALPDPARRLDSYPHELSGGQQQRVVIAMALAGDPDLLVADEPTTALDVTVQAQVLELIDRLRREIGLGVLLITHDLAVVAETCHRILVMYCGEIVESGPVAEVFRDPAHPYTRGLLAATPSLGRPAARGELPTIRGTAADPRQRPAGCPFHPRCPEVMERCLGTPPPPVDLGGERWTRCYLHLEEE